MKKYLFFLLALLLTNPFFAQNRISLSKAANNSFDLKAKAQDTNILELHTSLSYISSSAKSTDNGDFISLESEGLMGTFDAGKPDIPVYSRLIEVPLEASVKLNVISYDEEIIDLNAEGISQKVMPAQPSVSKSEEPDSFYYDKIVYSRNAYFNTTIAGYEEAGIMRSVRLGRIVLSPVQYNPVQNKLRVLNNLKVEIQFIGANQVKTRQFKAKYSSRLFDEVIEKFTQNRL